MGGISLVCRVCRVYYLARYRARVDVLMWGPYTRYTHWLDGADIGGAPHKQFCPS